MAAETFKKGEIVLYSTVNKVRGRIAKYPVEFLSYSEASPGMANVRHWKARKFCPVEQLTKVEGESWSSTKLPQKR